MLVNVVVENQPLTTKHRACLDDAYDAVERISWARFLKGRLALIQDSNLFRFCILHSYALLRVTFCVIITVSLYCRNL